VLRWQVEGNYDSAGFPELHIERRRLSALVAGAWWPFVAVVGGAVAVIAALAARTASTFQSDDSALFVAYRSWRSSGVSTYWTGSNSYGLRFPLIALIDALEPPGKEQLLIATAALVALTAIFLAWAAAVQAQSGLGAVSGAVAVAWVVSNPGVADAIARPTVRNVELGVAALGLVGLDRLGAAEPRRRAPVLVAVAVGLALFLWNDPYFTLVVAAPAIGIALVAAVLGRSLWRLAVAGTLMAGVVGSRLIDSAGSWFGIDALQVPFHYPKPSEQEMAKKLLFKQMPNAVGTTTKGTGLSDQQVLGNRLVIGLLVVCALLAIVWCARRWRELPVGTLTAVAMLVVPSLAWYASSNMLTDGRSWRYIMMTPFVLPILLVPAASALPHRVRSGFLGLAAVLMAFSLWSNVGDAKRAADCGLEGSCVPIVTLDQERQDGAYAAWLENSGVEKVLVPFWHSNTTTYLSGGQVPAVTIDCRNNILSTWRWLTTEARIDAPVTTSHIVLEGKNAAGCSAAQVTLQLGPPTSITKFADYQLWAYPGDITKRLPIRKG